MRKKGVLIIAIYSHIEAYPPSLNALIHLSSQFEKIYILHRNSLPSEWEYPENVEVIFFNKYVHVDQLKNLSFYEKLRSYYSFGYLLLKLVVKVKPSVILLYDALAFALANVFINQRTLHKSIIWYHNHDVLDANELSKVSLMWWMRKLELFYFHRINYFSLPNRARLAFFPIGKLVNPPVILPNFPSKEFYGKWGVKPMESDIIKIIFQGQISSTNSIDRLVNILPFRVQGKKIQLHLAGPVSENYISTILSKAKDLNVSDQVIFYGRLTYSKLPSLTSSCNIGIASYGSHNTMVKTMSTASNKIFEYASVGLPVIINNREDMRAEFAPYNWIHFTEFNQQELLLTIDKIIANYSTYSKAARGDFEQSLNFEKAFIPFVSSLLQNKQH